MKGCLGCLGAFVVLALLAWPIEVLAQVFGWSDAQTGYVVLAWFGLLAIGASKRGRGEAKRPASEAAQRRVGSVPAAHPAEAAGQRPVQVALGSGGRLADRISYPPGRRAARGIRPRAVLPARRVGTSPAPHGGGKARDPLPAQLRFRILQRDGFRCRYCGRPGCAPGVVLHVDHVVPLAAGGATSEGNLLTACEECNLGKAARAVVTAPRAGSSAPVEGAPAPIRSSRGGAHDARPPDGRAGARVHPRPRR